MESPSQKGSPPVKVGDRVSLRIDALAAGGDFIGRLGPFAIFVSGGAPSEIAQVEITEVSKTYARGRLLSIQQPSPDRIQPRCPHFGECGGCDLQHIYYPAQLAQKRLLVRETLRRIGGIAEVEIPPALGMEDPWAYRSKAEYFAGRDPRGHVFLGFLRRASHQPAAVSECAVQHTLNEKVRTAVAELMNLHAQGAQEKDSLVKVISRVSFEDERACVTLVTSGKPGFLSTLANALMEKIPEVSGVCHSRTRSQRAAHHSPAELLAGSPHLIERIGQWSFRISPDSFFQVNPRQTAVLTQVAESLAGVGEEAILIEGYSGVGTFLIPLAAHARMATGIEESESALADARANIRKHHLDNTRLYQGKVENILPRFAARKWHAGAVVLDPPRRGCGKGAITAAARLQPRALVLVSCDPATLARDLQFAAGAGYLPKVVQLVDMFPHTWHTESVALCVPEDS
jgi:23S rRNA (uracil1939-C5)-methyltransferase